VSVRRAAALIAKAYQQTRPVITVEGGPAARGQRGFDLMADLPLPSLTVPFVVGAV
jgi:hypothetical protein